MMFEILVLVDGMTGEWFMSVLELVHLEETTDMEP